MPERESRHEKLSLPLMLIAFREQDTHTKQSAKSIP
jgi:hypothetical protein